MSKYTQPLYGDSVGAGTDYFIETITGDGSTWKPITAPANIRSLVIKARSGNDSNVFSYVADSTEFNLAKTSTPGSDWVSLSAISIPIAQNESGIIGYVKSAASTYVEIIGMG